MSCKNLKLWSRKETKNGKLTWRTRNSTLRKNDQANKSVWWMPWHQAPMKDVISCEKLRGVANEL